MVIQRSWKILGDAGSTSASSTEANRSPMGDLNSSSDDSNCSNQTTTSVPSPPTCSVKMETSSIISNNGNNNTTPYCNQNQHQQFFNERMKFITTPQMADAALQKLRQRFSNTTSLTSSSTESAMRSLELVRIAVQSEFDKKISEMVKHFIEIYFKPAFNNIKENLGQGAINDDALQKMSCALLENAKSQYKILRYKPQISTTCNAITSSASTLENSTTRMALKRPALIRSTSTVINMQKRFFSESEPTQERQHSIPALPPVASIKATLSQNHHSIGFAPDHQRQPQSFQQPTNIAVPTHQLQPQLQHPHPRRQIFWNTAHISITTKFVLDIQANQAFGFGMEGKERLASKHPELIRYLPDNEDRDWLITQQIIKQQNRNSRFLFLIHEEVCRLYQTLDVYKNKASVDLSLMMTFTVPEFMIQKMKIFFVDLNIKSRGLITNSYSISGTAIQTPQQQPNSHLRNALLLGTSNLLPMATVATSNIAAISDSTTSALVGSPSSPSSNITSTETLLKQKSKSSNLSSSHATLTALLNNSSSSSVNTFVNSANLNLSPPTRTLLNKLRK